MSATKDELHDVIENGMREMTPDLFMGKPWGSILSNSEDETIASNIMRILSRTGNKFRDLTWEQYKEERLKDGEFTEVEKKHFDKVAYLSKGNPSEVLGFSDSWKEKYEKSIKA